LHLAGRSGGTENRKLDWDPDTIKSCW
jgi:hypothetical protein